MDEVTWKGLDWDTLDRLRHIFLCDAPPRGAYWTSLSDLANYDFTFGQRIAWKWDAVLRELRWRRWTPPSGVVLDWGCGSGIAGRRVLAVFGPTHFKALCLHDRSRLAVEFAIQAARREFPRMLVNQASPGLLAGEEPVGLLVVSHVLSELSRPEREHLLRLARRAEAILWVEPGTHKTSRDLLAVREELRADFRIIAPCTHQAICGMLTPGKERHWCHFLADAPEGVMADSAWVRFAKRAGIDLRRLPYSFLVLERPDRNDEGATLGVKGCSRIIGEPRFYKGQARLFTCQESGVEEFALLKRDAPDLFRIFKEGVSIPIYRFKISNGRIVAADPPG